MKYSLNEDQVLACRELILIIVYLGEAAVLAGFVILECNI